MQVLAPVETTPVFLARFTSKAPPDLIQFVKERLEESNVIVVTKDTTKEGQVVFGLTVPQRALEIEAEHIKLVKSSTPDPSSLPEGLKSSRNIFVMEHFTVESRKKFLVKNLKEDEQFSYYDSEGLFTSSDRVRLVWSILESISILPDGENTSNLSRKLQEMKVLHQDFSRNGTLNIGHDSEMRFKKLLHLLEEHNLIDLLVPAHIGHINKKLKNEIWKIFSPTPIQAFRDYFGEEIAYYFAWLKYMNKALLFPGMSGLIIWIKRQMSGDSVDTCTLTPFHGLLTFLWAVAFTRMWSREENRLAYRWGTFSATGYERRFFSVRPEFEGELRKSKVSGEMEKYYPERKRKLKYIVSGLVTLILLAGAFFVMILSLNLQGYIHHKHNPSRWGKEEYHPFHYSTLSDLAEKGHIFDVTSQYRSLVPVILHVIAVMCMNMGYRTVAEKLTEWENHETQVSHENSLIIKRFLFEAFDAYLVLFYLAFYERDVEKLRSELVSVFNVDTFRRLLLECIVPWVIQKVSRPNAKDKSNHKKSDDDTPQDYVPIDIESTKDEYEQFDDYLEMVIEFGYITLFASAYPLAAFVAIGSNFVECRMDAFKITTLCHRPRSIPRDNIGTWNTVIMAIVWLSAFTNCLIFSFSSMQMVQWLPEYFTIDRSGEHNFKQGKGWIVVLTVFSIEHILLVLGLLLVLLIPTVPKYIKHMEERKHYLMFYENQILRKKALEKSADADAHCDIPKLK